jgi:hypothetical protein
MQPPLLLSVHTRTLTRLLAQTRSRRRSTQRGARQRKRIFTITTSKVLVMTTIVLVASLTAIVAIIGGLLDR